MKPISITVTFPLDEAAALALLRYANECETGPLSVPDAVADCVLGWMTLGGPQKTRTFSGITTGEPPWETDESDPVPNIHSE